MSNEFNDILEYIQEEPEDRQEPNVYFEEPTDMDDMIVSVFELVGDYALHNEDFVPHVKPYIDWAIKRYSRKAVAAAFETNISETEGWSQDEINTLSTLIGEEIQVDPSDFDFETYESKGTSVEQ